MFWRGLEKELGKEWNMGQAGNIIIGEINLELELI